MLNEIFVIITYDNIIQDKHSSLLQIHFKLYHIHDFLTNYTFSNKIYRNPTDNLYTHSLTKRHAPLTSAHFVPKLAGCVASPAGVIHLGRSFHFHSAVHR